MIAPQLTTSLEPGRTFHLPEKREAAGCDTLHNVAHLSSTLAPKARVPPISEADKPPVVLLLDRFFHRVSERTVYASCLPTV